MKRGFEGWIASTAPCCWDVANSEWFESPGQAAVAVGDNLVRMVTVRGKAQPVERLERFFVARARRLGSIHRFEEDGTHKHTIVSYVVDHVTGVRLDPRPVRRRSS